MIDIPAAASDAYARTRYLLWERRSFGRWWRYALLCFLTGGNGGMNLRLPVGQPGDLKKKMGLLGLGLATAGLGNFDAKMVPFVLIFVIGLIFLGLFFGWLSNCAQFVLLESVVYDRHVLGESFSRLKGRGLGLMGWTLLMVLAFAVPICLTVAGAIGVGVLSDSEALNLPVMVVSVSLVGLLILGMCVFFSLTHHFVLPVAYRQRVSLNSAWGLVAGALRRNKVGTLLFMLALVGVSIASFAALFCGVLLSCCVTLVAGLLVIALPAILFYQAHMPVGAGLCMAVLGVLLIGTFLVSLMVIQTPFSIFSRSFGIYVMQQMLPEFGLLPLGGRPEKAPEEFSLNEDPLPLGALTEEAWQAPEL